MEAVNVRTGCKDALMELLVMLDLSIWGGICANGFISHVHVKQLFTN